jgi:uncharacterized beta-barrel protein YwiB (DUF1934 family)
MMRSLLNSLREVDRTYMLKKIRISIRSHIDNLDSFGLPEGDSEINDSIHSGVMKISDGEISVSYKESGEGGEVLSNILQRDGAVTVCRHGAIDSTLHFSKDGVFNTLYSIPPYKFDMTVTTLRIRADLSEYGGDIDILYLMDVGGAKKRCRMQISVSGDEKQ